MQELDIINMSLGIIDSRDHTKLKPRINQLFKKATIIAALSNKPLIFSNVIGVIRSETNADIDFCEMSICGINFRAKARYCLATNEGYSFIREGVNSFATPYVTFGIASRSLHKKSINTILSSFTCVLFCSYKIVCIKAF